MSERAWRDLSTVALYLTAGLLLVAALAWLAGASDGVLVSLSLAIGVANIGCTALLEAATSARKREDEQRRLARRLEKA